MFLNAYCGHCGTQILYEDSREFIYCWSCGEKVFRSELNLANLQPASFADTAPVQPAPAANAVPVQPAPAVNYAYPNPAPYEGPNLIVTYQTIHPEYPMFFRIRSTNEKFFISPGQSMSFRLSIGRQTLYFGFNNRYYTKNLWILDDAPIRINCSWDSRISIDIIRPSAVYNTQG